MHDAIGNNKIVVIIETLHQMRPDFEYQSDNEHCAESRPVNVCCLVAYFNFYVFGNIATNNTSEKLYITLFKMN
jgi:hypothetical protein